MPRFASGGGGFRPQVDSFRTDEPPELTVIVELPGIDPDDVQVLATGRVLVVAGERRRPPGDGRVYQQMEIDYGPFRREVALPEPVDTGGARASYERGLLTIVLPLAPRAREGVRVPIEVRTRP